MANKLSFEFDFDEVFEGIKQGVIRELSEINFEEVKEQAIKEIKNEVKQKISVTYKDECELIDEIKGEIKEKVFDSLIREVGDKYLNQFNSYVNERLLESPSEINSLKKEIRDGVSEELYKNLFSSIKKDVTAKIQNVVSKLLSSIDGTEIKVKGTEESISKEELNELRHRNEVLSALEAGGVDNWEWYGESINQYFGERADR